MEKIDWDQFPNFSPEEFACQHCGKEGIDGKLVYIVQKIREDVHASGLAVDIGASHEKAYIILKLAIQRNMPGIGINQKGNGRFIHLDISKSKEERPRPHLWSY